MKRISRILVLGGIAAAAFVALLAALFLLMPGGGEDTAQAHGGDGLPPTIFGVDVDPYTLADVNTNVYVGAVESCIEVSNGQTFDIDVFLDDVPSPRDLAGAQFFMYYDNTYLQVNGWVGPLGFGCFDWLLRTQPGSGACIEAGDTAFPDTDGTLNVALADPAGLAGAELPGARGVLDRYEMQVVAPGPQVVAITTAGVPTYLASSVPVGYDPDEVWDGNYAAPYGLIAIDTPCPEPADVKKTVFEALDDQLQPLPQPLELEVSETYWLKLHEQLHNNGPTTPLPVELTVEGTPPEGGQVSYHVSQDDLDLPGDLLVTKNGQPWVGPPHDGGLNPPESTEFVVQYPNVLDVHKQVDLVQSDYVDLYEDWDIHCLEPSTHTWHFHNEVWPLDPYVPDPDPLNNWQDLDVVVDCTAESDVKVLDVYPSSTPDPMDPFVQPTIIIGEDTPLGVTTDVHNNGPHGPLAVDITSSHAIADYYGGNPAQWPTWGNQGCTLTPPSPSLVQIADLEVSASGATVVDDYTINCDMGGIGWDDDADTLVDEDFVGGPGYDNDHDGLVDEDVCNGADDDADTLTDEDPPDGDDDCDGAIDEDSPFYLVAVNFQSDIQPKSPHIADPDDLNDSDDYTLALAVVRPFTPSYSLTVDDMDPDQQTYPVSDVCTVGLPCKSLTQIAVPVIPPPTGPPAGQSLPVIMDVIGSMPGEWSLASGLEIPIGEKVGRADYTVNISLLPNQACNVPLVESVDLYDACLPPPGDPYIPASYLAQPECAVDLPSQPAALAAPAAYSSWSHSLDSVVRYIYTAQPTAYLWARYSSEASPVTGLVINVLVFDLSGQMTGGLGAGPWLRITVAGDPAQPSSIYLCPPFVGNLLILGQTPISAVPILTCDQASPALAVFAPLVRRDIDTALILTDTVTCLAAETDVYCDLDKDETPYAPVKLEHQETVDVVVTNGAGPDDVSVELTLRGPLACQPEWKPAYGHDPDPPTPINGDQESVISFLMSDVLGRGMYADETAIASLEYEVYCEAGTHNLQIAANVMPMTIPDPDTGNNDCLNQPVLTAEEDDVDDDTVVNWLDDCPWDPEDLDGIQDEDGCPETDADSDGILDEADLCPEDPEDPDGIQDEDGCPETDADSDGILDEVDLCPEDAEDFDGIQDEDGCPETDADSDGFPDDQEVSLGSDPLNDASTPEHIDLPWTCTDGIDNDLDGLPDLFDCDTDGDGIANYFDACPFTAEDMDGYQDDDGCPDTDNDMDGVCDPWAAPSQPACTGSDGCPNVAEDIDSFKDTDGCPDPDNDGDGFPDSTDQCPGTDWTAGPDGIADSGDEPLDELGVPIQTKEDYDGVIDWDGCHDSPGDDYDGDGMSDEVEVLEAGTDPTDMDTDNDGLCDGHKLPLCASEDANNNGIVDPGETDPLNPDTDGDGLSDGLESGLTVPETPDTDTSSPNWQPDTDPASTTDPLNPDSDGDGILDGAEDTNHDGGVDPGETDANDDDTDDDGYGDAADNCPTVDNPAQVDGDTDGAGNACDVCTSDPDDDADNDGICVDSGYLPPKTGDNDNCTAVANPDQADADTDAAGNACDNCVLVANALQEDFDADRAGDACDPDDDNGGTPDGQEIRDGTDPFDPGDDPPLDMGDPDSDGGKTWEEYWSGTDPDDACGNDCDPNPPYGTHDAWLFDLNIDCWVNSSDILLFPEHIAMPAELGVEPTYQCRYDLDGSNWINSSDILLFPQRVAMPKECTNP